MSYKIPQPVLGWIANHSRKNYWRVASFYEIEDLINDGVMKAMEVIERYGHPGLEIDNPHYMRLVQSSFNNHIVDLLRKNHPRFKTKIVEERKSTRKLLNEFKEEIVVNDYITVSLSSLTEDGSQITALESVLGGEEGEQDYGTFISEMPEMLRKAVVFYLNSPEKFRSFRRRLSGEVETLSSKLARLVGLPEDFDFESELRTYIWEYDKGYGNEADEPGLDTPLVCAVGMSKKKKSQLFVDSLTSLLLEPA